MYKLQYGFTGCNTGGIWWGFWASFGQPVAEIRRETRHIVKVEIYSTGKNDWILEIVDADGNSCVWGSTFETDDMAFKEFQRTVEEDGIGSVIGPPRH